MKANLRMFSLFVYIYFVVGGSNYQERVGIPLTGLSPSYFVLVQSLDLDFQRHIPLSSFVVNGFEVRGGSSYWWKSISVICRTFASSANQVL